jgi:hypothetical protein
MKAKAKAKRTKTLPVRGKKAARVAGGTLRSSIQKKMDDTIAGQQQKIG